MRLEERAVGDAAGTILMHNVADEAGTRVLKKGIRLTEEHLAELSAMGRTHVQVAVLEAGDVHEDEAAQRLAEALRTDAMHLSRPTGGRINLRAVVDGLLEVDAGRLLALNLVPGIALATRRQWTVVGPGQETDNLATLKIVPYAVRRPDLEQAVALAAARPGILEVRPFPRQQRAALLLVGDAMVRPRLRRDYEGPTRARLERLGTELGSVEGVEQEEGAIARAVARLGAEAELLIIAGQTSVMDEEDTTLRGLRRAGAETTAAGAPVEPGNLMALAYLPRPGGEGQPVTPVLCAPGCAKGMKRNVVDLILPRLVLGDRLERADIAALGLGGFLTAAERGGDVT
jgi:molybdenum cofactor cytidylyltransferase